VTLTIHKEENDVRELKLTVEVSEDQVEKAMRKKARELGRDMGFSGFRKGKVPYRVVVQRLGRDAIRADAIDDIVQTVFVEAVEEAEVEPYGRPSLDDVQPEPLVFEFTIPLEPVVTLGEDYREMRREIEAVAITDEAVEEALEQVQTQHQTTEVVDRAVDAGDLVTIGGQGVLLALVEVETVDEEAAEEEDQEAEQEGTAEPETETLFDQERLELLMDSEKLFPGTPFVDNLLGREAGDKVSFGFTFPEDYEEEDLAGREASFDLYITEVKSRDIPDLDDELAKLDGNYETLDEMRAGLREQLEKQAENQAKEDLIESMIDDLLVDADILYPPAAVEMEIDEMVDSFKSQITRSGWELDDYLRIQGSTEESLRDDFRDNAQERLRRRLILRAFMLEEKLRVETADVEAQVDEQTSGIENEELRKQMHDFYLSGAGFDMISSQVLSEKVYERIVAILSGNAPDLEALAAEEEDNAASEEE
jgi:trigger factor